MMEVAHRDAATLIPIIQQYIRPGSIICSDEWAAYNQITAATGMAHMTVNHSLNFVDPATGVHTQGVESMWSCCKCLMREERTMHFKLFETYLPEFMWRRRFGEFGSAATATPGSTATTDGGWSQTDGSAYHCVHQHDGQARAIHFTANRHSPFCPI